jgi:hypothetical protein
LTTIEVADLDGQARLARATGSCQRHQVDIRPVEQRHDLGKLGRASDQRR